MAVRVGRWDCDVCGHIGNYGPHTKCASCGASRPANVKFYLPKDAEIVTDKEQLKEARAGVDWICGHCYSQNKAKDTVCNSCGNPRDESSEDINLEEKEYNLNEVPIDGSRERKIIHQLEKQQLADTPRKSPLRKVIIGIFVILGFIAMLRIFPKEITVTVDQFQWERTLQMEHKEPVQEEDWTLPSGAFNTSSFEAIKEYKQVFRGYETRTRTVQVPVGQESYVCGQIDKGNGYFEDKYCTRTIYESREETYQEEVYDQVPVYATKYRYSIMRWVSHKENLLKTSGQNHEPSWPSTLGKDDPDEWKKAKRTEQYFILVKESDGDIHKEKLGLDYWQGLSLGQELKAKKSFLFDMYYGLASPEKD